MRHVDPSEETVRAARSLARAYERARSTGYRAGSPAVLALQHAEQAHQQSRAQDELRRTGPPRSVGGPCHDAAVHDPTDRWPAGAGGASDQAPPGRD